MWGGVSGVVRKVVVREEGRLRVKREGESAEKVGARTRACSCEQRWRGHNVK